MLKLKNLLLFFTFASLIASENLGENSGITSPHSKSNNNVLRSQSSSDLNRTNSFNSRYSSTDTFETKKHVINLLKPKDTAGSSSNTDNYQQTKPLKVDPSNQQQSHANEFDELVDLTTRVSSADAFTPDDAQHTNQQQSHADELVDLTTRVSSTDTFTPDDAQHTNQLQPLSNGNIANNDTKHVKYSRLYIRARAHKMEFNQVIVSSFFEGIRSGLRSCIDTAGSVVQFLCIKDNELDYLGGASMATYF